MASTFCLSRVWLAQALLASTVALGQASPPRGERSVGSVILHFVDSYGGPLALSDVRRLVVLNKAGVDLAPTHFDGALRDLPFGDYSIQASVPGFKIWTSTVHVDRPVTWLTVGMQVRDMENDLACRVSGVLVGFKPAPRPVWIRLIQLYSNDVVESEVDAKGGFRVARLPCGKYILAVMSDDRPAQLTTVALRLSTQPLSIPFEGAEP